MNTATITTHDVSFEHQLVDLARYARKAATDPALTGPGTTLPLRDWLTYLADDLQHHADTLRLPTTETGDVAPAEEHPLVAIKQALEQLGNTARHRLIAVPSGSTEAHRLDELVQSLDMHWWVCHRAAA
ncbi:hypothetical protein BWI15_13550 [Kribbella sp. ALI-6-A]|uniref:hypothetical protein n=1 Tax=Kribbella sp. ALI-6-A TaxID=1933817 RepID=UPI00097C686A|nr:hypothetical protein [Kribbella sp. ALI-6-A]ONI74337.1 hypothetical protein BWI15_13550 [Kribbella sp. ALI-6-A]